MLKQLLEKYKKYPNLHLVFIAPYLIILITIIFRLFPADIAFYNGIDILLAYLFGVMLLITALIYSFPIVLYVFYWELNKKYKLKLWQNILLDTIPILLIIAEYALNKHFLNLSLERMF